MKGSLRAVRAGPLMAQRSALLSFPTTPTRLVLSLSIVFALPSPSLSFCLSLAACCLPRAQPRPLYFLTRLQFFRRTVNALGPRRSRASTNRRQLMSRPLSRLAYFLVLPSSYF